MGSPVKKTCPGKKEIRKEIIPQDWDYPSVSSSENKTIHGL